MTPQRRTPDLLAVLALLAACFAVYGQTLGYGFINFDDPGYVFENPTVCGGLSWAGFHWAWTTFTESNWHPLTWLSLMADAQLYGVNAGGYHLTNLLLHSANCALLFAWLRQAAGAFWPSLLTAMLFAVHPLHVESVAWISERKDVLSTFFALLTLLAYTRGWHAASLAAFAVGLAAKPMLVTLPALMMLVDYWPLRRGGLRLWEKAPFFLLSAASCIVTVAAQRAGHAVVPYGALSIPERVSSAVTAAAAYVGMTFWPANLGVYYPYWSQRPAWQAAAGAGMLVALTIITWKLRRKAPYAAMGWAWFLVALAPVIGIVQVGGQAMADRYTYLPHVGLFIALAWGAAELAWGQSALAVSAAACLALAARQAGYWRDGATLFAHTHAVTRPSVNLCTLYGDACVGARRLAEAERVYREGLRLRPGNADLLAKLGYAYAMQEKWQAAIATLTEADRLRPDDAGTLCNLGRALNRSGRKQDAAAVYTRCLRAHPDSIPAQLGNAETLLALGQSVQAAGAYEAVLASNPDHLSALNHLAWLLALGAGEQPADPANALVLARRAAALTHSADMDSLDSLAAALASNGDWAGAAAAAEAAWKIAQREGVPPTVVDIRRERLELYRARQWPQR